VKIFSTIKEHSERISHKNFLALEGRPLWRWLIDELYPHEIFINTDCSNLLIDSGLPSHVRLIERDQRHIDWESDASAKGGPALDMLRSFIEGYVDNEDEIVVLTHVTSPFLRRDTLSHAIEFLDRGWKSVHSVEVIQDRVLLENMSRAPTPINFDPAIVERTQDLSRVFVSKGAFFAFRAIDFLDTGMRVIDPCCYFPLSRIEAIEIDTGHDLEAARTVAKGLRGLNGRS
jgi:CMP-N-acetylneuraminic acid synthetase